MSYNPVTSSSMDDAYSPTSQIQSTLITSFVDLRARQASSSGSDHASSTSSSKSAKCSGSKEKCQTGVDTTNGETIGLSIGIPVAVFLCIIGFFFYRSYKKGKKEAESDNDPDFYGESTILPDYPAPKGQGGNTREVQDDMSFYSNPFANDSARYPSNVMNNSAVLNQSQNRPGGGRSEPYYETFKLPYEHMTGSHASLDEFAKEMGSEYPAYRISSRPNSPYTNRSANSSSMNVSTNKNTRNLTEKTYSMEDPTTDSSTSYRESKFNTENILGETPLAKTAPSTVTTPDDEFEDAEDENDYNLNPKNARPQSHYRQDSDVSYLDEPEVLQNSFKKSVEDDDSLEIGSDDEDDRQIQTDSHQAVNKLTVPTIETTTAPLNDTPAATKGEEDDDSEDIKRMKSVYRVYFDRENSVRKPTEVPQSDVPPLPAIETNPENVFEPEVADEPVGSLDPKQSSSNNNFLSAAPQLDTQNESSIKNNRAVSSIYSSIPLAQFDENQQLHHQLQQEQYYHQQQQQPPQQSYYPQQTPQHQMYQAPYYGGGPGVPGSPQVSQRSYAPPKPLKPLQTVPSPSKINYDSIVTQTDFAPKKSLTSAASGYKKPDLSIKPFNPLHVSDQIFSPTSPISPSAAQFQNFPQQPQSFNKRDITPPSPHHIRQSIVMVDPVEIGKQKIYRPAGSFSQMHGEISSRNGSMTSQSAYNDSFNQAPMQAAPFTSQTTYQSPSSEELPRSGSKADLRTQLGSSDNYNFGV